jgi:hypothetical protein
MVVAFLQDTLCAIPSVLEDRAIDSIASSSTPSNSTSDKSRPSIWVERTAEWVGKVPRVSFASVRGPLRHLRAPIAKRSSRSPSSALLSSPTPLFRVQICSLISLHSESTLDSSRSPTPGTHRSPTPPRPQSVTSPASTSSRARRQEVGSCGIGRMRSSTGRRRLLRRKRLSTLRSAREGKGSSPSRT